MAISSNVSYHTSRSVGIYTLGCKVNQYESEAIAELFSAAGYRILPSTEVCDVYVINTCTVTAESDRKARQAVRRAVKKNPDAVIVVTGCYAQVSPEEVLRIDGVDLVVGNTNKSEIPAYVQSILTDRESAALPLNKVTSIEGAPFEAMCISRFDRTRAYVKIEDGCESRCTYCIIPSARGSIRSKPLADVIKEVTALTKSGCPEVVLTGIETASYGRDLDGVTLATLLKEVDRIPNIGRVRLGSLDPSLIKPAFVSEIKELGSLAPQFHLSMQSGSNAVLRRMRRKYNRDQALNALSLLREAIPRVQFTTDIIVGFPGETEEDFLDTVSLIRDGGFLMTHVFPYSKRKGTLAAEMEDQIPEDVKHERVLYLSEIAKENRARILREAVEAGRTEYVLFETSYKGYITGHTDNFLEVTVKCDTIPRGHPVPVCLLSSDETSATGVLLHKDE